MQARSKFNCDVIQQDTRAVHSHIKDAHQHCHSSHSHASIYHRHRWVLQTTPLSTSTLPFLSQPRQHLSQTYRGRWVLQTSISILKAFSELSTTKWGAVFWRLTYQSIEVQPFKNLKFGQICLPHFGHFYFGKGHLSLLSTVGAREEKRCFYFPSYGKLLMVLSLRNTIPNTNLNAIFSYDADIYVANILININKIHITCLDSGVNNIIHYSVYKTC